MGNTNNNIKHLDNNAEINKISIKPWGSYCVLDQKNNYKVKRIDVNPHEALSLQLHYHRSEHWIIVSGIATITIDDNIMTLHENQSVFINKETKHRLANLHDQLLSIIEIQYGDYLGEDDIVRFEDKYNRINK